MITFKVDTTKFKKHIETFTRQIASTEAPFKNAIREVHDRAERRIKDKLRNTTTRDPAATFPGTGSNVKRIEQSIRSKLWRQGLKVIAVTGDTAIMDKEDPLVLKGSKHKLWRILESGAQPHEIVARGRTLKFFWKRLGIFVGAPESSEGHSPTQTGPAVIALKKVNHPGQRGRFFIQNTKFDLKNDYRKYVLKPIIRMLNGQNS